MIRTYSAGVHFGVVEKKEGKELLLVQARRVYSWAGACSLSQLATEGSKEIADCRISVPVQSLVIEYIEIIPMTENAVINLSSKDALWKK